MSTHFLLRQEINPREPPSPSLSAWTQHQPGPDSTQSAIPTPQPPTSTHTYRLFRFLKNVSPQRGRRALYRRTEPGQRFYGNFSV